MSFTNSHIRIICVFILSILMFSINSCVSDVDLDQIDEIVLRPRVEADLVFFTVESTDFETIESDNFQITIRDTTRLEFLDDTVIQEYLRELELTYAARNTFVQGLVNRSMFINDIGDIQYEVSFPINASQNGEEVTTIFQTVLNEQDVEAVRNATVLVNEVTLFVNGQVSPGMLSLQSKALYALEISDL